MRWWLAIRRGAVLAPNALCVGRLFDVMLAVWVVLFAGLEEANPAALGASPHPPTDGPGAVPTDYPRPSLGRSLVLPVGRPFGLGMRVLRLGWLVCWVAASAVEVWSGGVCS